MGWLRPILVFSLSLGQAEQQYNKLVIKPVRYVPIHKNKELKYIFLTLMLHFLQGLPFIFVESYLENCVCSFSPRVFHEINLECFQGNSWPTF